MTEGPERKRRHVRFAYTGKVELVVKGSTEALRGTMLDLSKEGCLLMLLDSCELAHGTGVEVLFRLNQQAFRVQGAVTNHRSDHRVAIQFNRLDPGVGRQLGTLCSIRSKGRENRTEEQSAMPDVDSAEAPHPDK